MKKKDKINTPNTTAHILGFV